MSKLIGQISEPGVSTSFAKLLTEIGLTENEAQIYQCLLTNRDTAASKISALTGISRSSVYGALANLQSQGLVSCATDRPVAAYSAEEPQVLNEFVARRKQDIERSQLQLMSVMDKLLDNYQLATKHPGIFRFEGREGMYKVYDELIKDRQTVNSIVSRKVLREFLAEYNPKYIAKRRRYGIRSRVITTDQKPIPGEENQELRDVRYINLGFSPFLMDFKVTDTRVVLTKFIEETAFGVVIMDEVLTSHFLALFEFLWAVADKQPDSRLKSKEK